MFLEASGLACSRQAYRLIHTVVVGTEIPATTKKCSEIQQSKKINKPRGGKYVI
jgi:hypothetical protein